MFRFSVSDMLWLTALVTVAVCWWLDRRTLEIESEIQQVNDQAEILAMFKKSPAGVLAMLDWLEDATRPAPTAEILLEDKHRTTGLRLVPGDLDYHFRQSTHCITARD